MTVDGVHVDEVDLRPRVRLVSESDLARVSTLDEKSRVEVLGQKGGAAWAAEHGHAQDVMNADRTRTFVVEFSGELVGFAVCIEREVPLRGRVLLIERVYVDVDFREIGCGDALVSAAMDLAMEQDCHFIEAVALPGDRETKNLYERAGITARSITVSKEISGPSIEEPASR